MLEVEALFATADEQLQCAPRDPDLVLSLHCELACVLDLTEQHFYGDLGPSRAELVSLSPSLFILDAREEENAYPDPRSRVLIYRANLCPQGSKRCPRSWFRP
jgi:hypothetical protein